MFKAAGAAKRGIFPRPFSGTASLFQSFWKTSGTDEQKSRPRWSRDEELYLARDYARGTDVGFIAGLIGRPISAVRRKALRLGVHRPRSGRAAKAANAMNAPPPRTFLN